MSGIPTSETQELPARLASRHPGSSHTEGGEIDDDDDSLDGGAALPVAVAHPHPLRSHPCHGIIAAAVSPREDRCQLQPGETEVEGEWCLHPEAGIEPWWQQRLLDEQQLRWRETSKEFTGERKKTGNTAVDSSASPYPTPMIPVAAISSRGGIGQAASELHRRHRHHRYHRHDQQEQQQTSDTTLNSSSLLGGNDDAGENETSVRLARPRGTIDTGDDDNNNSHRRSVYGVLDVPASYDNEEDHDDSHDEEDPVMILGTVRRQSRMSSILLRQQHEQGRRCLPPAFFTPHSRSSRADNVEDTLSRPARRGDSVSTTPGNPPQASEETYTQQVLRRPPVIPMVTGRSAQSQYHATQQWLARAISSRNLGEEYLRQSLLEPSPPRPLPTFHSWPLLAAATITAQRQPEHLYHQPQHYSQDLAPRTVAPLPLSKRTTFHSLAYITPKSTGTSTPLGQRTTSPLYSGITRHPERPATPALTLSRSTTMSSRSSRTSKARPQSPYSPPPTASSAFPPPPPDPEPSPMCTGVFERPKLMKPSSGGSDMPGSANIVEPLRSPDQPGLMAEMSVFSDEPTYRLAQTAALIEQESMAFF
ncbi:hypothetical protein MN608_05621 [Microdochium nivale]|nr:hypothetical protein MN608_05621 [Microdochium nivale]